MTRSPSSGASLGVVAIGRNEGERLVRCLRSVLAQCDLVVYVDSGSQDESVENARALGAEIVELDTSAGFTAARARNEGWRRLKEIRPDASFVQFVDGDCELVPGWLSTAREAMLARPEVAVVCGRRRELFREATIYNRLCDLEWDTPVGETGSCGGDALMRVSALERAGGFDPALIAGEEPDLCLRLRSLGHVVLRIDAEMTRHDAAMTRIGQWWRRMIRSGYAAAASVGRHGRAASPDEFRRARGAVLWVSAVGVALLAGTVLAFQRDARGAAVAGALVLLALVAQTLRIAIRRRRRGDGASDSLLYGASCVAAKLPESVGLLRYLSDRARRIRPRLIEYK